MCSHVARREAAHGAHSQQRFLPAPRARAGTAALENSGLMYDCDEAYKLRIANYRWGGLDGIAGTSEDEGTFTRGSCRPLCVA